MGSKFGSAELERIKQEYFYIVNHLEEKWTIKKICSRAGVSKEELYKGVVHLYGMLPGAYLMKMRMQTAKFLLIHTDRNIKQIAGLIGYKKSKNFMVAFKRYFRMTAGEVRRAGKW